MPEKFKAVRLYPKPGNPNPNNSNPHRNSNANPNPYRRLLRVSNRQRSNGLTIGSMPTNRQWQKFNKNNPLWQSNYYDHIIRDVIEYQYIAEYIVRNLMEWKDEESDEE